MRKRRKTYFPNKRPSLLYGTSRYSPHCSVSGMCTIDRLSYAMKITKLHLLMSEKFKLNRFHSKSGWVLVWCKLFRTPPLPAPTITIKWISPNPSVNTFNLMNQIQCRRGRFVGGSFQRFSCTRSFRLHTPIVRTGLSEQWTNRKSNQNNFATKYMPNNVIDLGTVSQMSLQVIWFHARPTCVRAVFRLPHLWFYFLSPVSALFHQRPIAKRSANTLSPHA